MKTSSSQDNAQQTKASDAPELRFDAGTLILDGAAQSDAALQESQVFRWDERTRQWRAPAYLYRQAVTMLVRQGIPYQDTARNYFEFQFRSKKQLDPRPYQQEAIAAWTAHRRRGVVVLPTGAGKTLVAEMAIANVGRSTLVVVPTIDLMNQWYDELLESFDAEIGLIGGGYFETGAIIVTTYSSAFRFMERMGNRFGLLVFDECHHLPSRVYRYAAELAIAPFRLGLTATPERADAGEQFLTKLIGPVVYRREAQHLAGEYLADYRHERVPVRLTGEERAVYERERQVYSDFIKRERIDFSRQDGWQQFVFASARSEAGRRAMLAYRESKRIALGTTAKLAALADILQRHSSERAIIFTAENELVYRISQQFLIPAITHETPIKERRHWLEAFNRGEVLALVTSKVLNEGVNIPEAAIAVVLSGSGSTREHIQRLGRILRPSPGKQAVLYEVISTDTAEERISERRTDARQFQAGDSDLRWMER
jgi:superfamily II DNA or RNA helicase